MHDEGIFGAIARKALDVFAQCDFQSVENPDVTKDVRGDVEQDQKGTGEMIMRVDGEVVDGKDGGVKAGEDKKGGAVIRLWPGCEDE